MMRVVETEWEIFAQNYLSIVNPLEGGGGGGLTLYIFNSVF